MTTTRINTEGLRNRAPTRPEAPQPGKDTAVSTALPSRIGTIANTRVASTTTLGPRGDSAELSGQHINPDDIYTVAPMPKGEALKEVVDLAKVSKFGYHRDTALLPGDYATSTEMAQALRQRVGLPETPGKKGTDPKLFGTIVDPSTGMVATLTVTAAKKQIVLSFAGANSGLVAGDPKDLVLGNADLTWKHYVDSNLGAGFGKMPPACKAATRLAAEVQKMMAEDPRFEGHELVLASHSKGGPEAACASLSLKDSPRVVGFCPAPGSDGLWRRFSKEKRAQAKQLLHFYSPKNDGVPSLGKPGKLLTKVLEKLGGRTMQIGTHHFYDPDSKIGAGLPRHIEDLPGLNAHLQYDQHLDSYARSPAAQED